MKRRNFLIGIGGTAIGGGALVGSGAFSRVESQRDVTIQVAEDPSAYLGLSGTGSPNSNNYVSIDDHGHLAIDIADSGHGPGDGGQGVNSDSFTYFDGMVEVCNQGKEEVGFYIEPPTDDDFPSGVGATGPDGTPYEDEPRLQFYTGEAAGSGDDGTNSVMGEDNAVAIPLGECIELGVRTMTKGVDASDDTGVDQLFGDELLLIADVDTEGEIPVQEEFPTNPFLEDAQTYSGGLFANLGDDTPVPLEEGMKMSEFPTADGSPFGLNGQFMQPVYMNRTSEPIEIEVETIGFGPTNLTLNVGPYNGTQFGTDPQWYRIPTGLGTPYPIVAPDTAWDDNGNFEGGPIAGGPDSDYLLKEISETDDGFKVVWELIGGTNSMTQSTSEEVTQDPEDDAEAYL